MIVDYGIGNVASVANMLRYVGAESLLSDDPTVIRQSAKIVLPGVGSFDAGISALRARGLDVALVDAVARGAYLLGICLGAQLLLDKSAEGSLPGLGMVPGGVRRLQVEDKGLRVPHTGWNVVVPSPSASLFTPDGERRFYFAHSYYIDCASPADVAATCSYGQQFTCAIERDRVLGVQFHPEKSHRFGMDLFRRFATLPISAVTLCADMK